MNNERRKRIAAVLESLEDAKNEIDQLAEEERAAYDNLPESIQDSERGCAMDEAAETLESASSSIEEAIDYLNEIQ